MLILFKLLAAINALACTCAPLTVQEKFAASDIIATVKVKSVNDLRIELEAIQAWKGGKKLKDFVVKTTDSMCGYVFTEGEKYLVYAKKEKNDYMTTGCSGNLALNDAGKDILWMKIRNQKK